jgi:hypothetical protein
MVSEANIIEVGLNPQDRGLSIETWPRPATIKEDPPKEEEDADSPDSEVISCRSS